MVVALLRFLNPSARLAPAARVQLPSRCPRVTLPRQHRRALSVSASMASPANSALVVWLHGLGDSGAGWTDLQQMLGPAMPHVKWVFPDAPVQKVSCNMGMSMPSWFDLPDIPVTPTCREDPASFKAAVKSVHLRIQKEMEASNIPPERVIIGGFSQGGALATQAMLQYPEKLAGAVCFSGWLVDRDNLQPAIQPANQQTPLLWCHGESDPTVSHSNQKEGGPLLSSIGVAVEVKSYSGLGHSACPKEFEDLGKWLAKQIPAAELGK
mmetsp:Transcript_10467/g.17977  ORF Transcript_10467/g.17977 Transcript_10467/m.17977 type:complete len:267 (+) Transcript_10467:91-891(+)|eukprot:CAMPEP_0198203934 /NCGR_PEP_ID=MMETSP1445-20131203/7271_1 /TAXON_ID=36898 /ORGANISM="Pyramimonas sp., Strain CCMP2087" /LENGTH=266 /DNA_ID=CAMNT_0043875541 /DNA_START=86 /DNA_END=886 /DNA_ORIENTATION=-